ncbi:uncharacterized protein LOC110874954 [Helianthus annuus]|uniref:uncharacterized protein LOC110874954 n=1 Tax=Helianthus annuus TaxID=4232 RepID=UPI0016533C74|nr:uncharacterized protein LOC110874954 [Helianthus annuus]
MPFIQIVGMTPTNKSFIIAHAVVSKERGDNFVWVLERVKSMLDECMEPRVILTDRDLALMGACAKVFPDASRLLCRWHIQQNVMKHCKGAFTDDDWKKFMSFWGTLIESPSIPIYDYHLRNMRKRLVECKRSRVFKYVYDNWLKDYKEMFVFAWTDKRRNFGNRTTNRVESQHANLKRYVEDRSSLDRIVGCVRDIVETQFGEIRKTFRESIEKTMKHHKHPMFQHLLGKVSHKALDLLHGEAIRKLDVLERFNSSCGCQMWHSCGLPCACRIEKYMREERPIQLEDIDVFWRKLNFQSCKLIDDSLDVVEELDVVRQQLQSHPPAQQKSLLSKIKAVYRELLVEFLSSFTFHPPGEPVPLPYPGAPHPPEVSFRLAGVMRSMTLAQFAVHCGLYMQEEIETEIYTAGLVVVEKPTLVGFWQVIAGADHWEHEKSKGRVSFVRDPLYRYLHHLLATSISARGYSREWCTTTDLFFLYCLLYRRPCALAHGLAQYFASGHHRQERGFLYGGAYVTVIARSLGLVPHQDPHLRTPAIMPTRMGMQSLWGMRVIKRFPVGPRFKNRDGGVWREEALPEHFEPVHPPADPADVVPVEDPPEDLDGAAEPQPPPPAGAPQFPRHVIRGRAPGAALHPDVRARLDRLDDLI